LAPARRLSCSSRVAADVVIDVPAGSQAHRQVVRKEADARVIELDPVVHLHYVQVTQPDMHDPSGDLRRLFERGGRLRRSHESAISFGEDCRLSYSMMNPGGAALMTAAVREALCGPGVEPLVPRRGRVIASPTHDALFRLT